MWDFHQKGNFIYMFLVQNLFNFFSTDQSAIKETYFEGFQAMDQIGEAPGRSILTFSSPFLLRMLTTPFIMPRARYCPSFVHL